MVLLATRRERRENIGREKRVTDEEKYHREGILLIIFDKSQTHKGMTAFLLPLSNGMINRMKREKGQK